MESSAKAIGYESWDDYFSEYRRKVNDLNDDAAEASVAVEEPELILPATEAVGKELRGKPAAMLKRLLALGYTARVDRALVRMPPTRFMSATDDHAAGDVRFPAYTLEAFYLIAWWKGEAPGQAVGMEAAWESKWKDDPDTGEPKPGSLSFKIATTFDPYLGYEVRTSATKPRPQNAVEKELGIEPPAGFQQWFDMIVPK